MTGLRSWVKWLIAAALIAALVLPTSVAAASEDAKPQVAPTDVTAATNEAKAQVEATDVAAATDEAKPQAEATDAVMATDEAKPQAEATDEAVASRWNFRRPGIELRRERAKRFAAARRFWNNPWIETRRQARQARSDAIRQGFQHRRTWSDALFDRQLRWEDPWANQQHAWFDQQADWQPQQVEHETARMERGIDAQADWMLSHQPMVPVYPYYGW